MSSKYQMWFKHNNGKEKFQFPVLPSEIKVQFGSKNESTTVSGLGEITIPQDRPAAIITFSSFFPAAMFPGVEVSKLKKPSTIVKGIQKWRNSSNPVLQFIVTGTLCNLFVTIEDFTVTEKGGDVGTLHYTIKLKEYRSVTIRKINTSKNNAPNRVNTSVKGKTYTVKNGDCLWTIARSQLGDATRWSEIYNLNKTVIEAECRKRGVTASLNGHYIYTGTVLKLPS